LGHRHIRALIILFLLNSLICIFKVANDFAVFKSG
jgi:hypothetical protein